MRSLPSSGRTAPARARCSKRSQPSCGSRPASIEFQGERIDGLSVESIVARRLIQIPEGRQLFGPLTVRENLELGSYSRRRRGSSDQGSIGAGVRPVSPSQRTCGSAGGHPLRRRAADAGNRSGSHGRAEASAARRALHGFGADPGQGHLHQPSAAERRGVDDDPGRAGRAHRPRVSPTRDWCWSEAGWC